MPVVRNASGEIWVPSNSNRDLAIFLIFAGVATSFPIRYVLDHLFPTQNWHGATAPAGFMMVLLGLYLMRYTRKRFWVVGQTVHIKDGHFGSVLRYSWEEPPKIRLRSVEEERGRESVEFWQVYLVDGKRQYLMDREEGHQIECRSLAEALAKTINCPVLEAGEKGEIVIPREELDLPFRERVRKNPELLGAEVSRPAACPVELEEAENQHVYRWNLRNGPMLTEFMTLAILIFLLAVVPIFPGASDGHGHPPERFQRSYVDLARQMQRYEYFYVTGTILGLGAIVLFGYGKELRVSSQSVAAQDRLWGVPVWSATIPADKLEEIWVRQSARGAHLQLISDDEIITGRTSSADVAAWMASRIRRFYS
jgi:hypothetical protein